MLKKTLLIVTAFLLTVFGISAGVAQAATPPGCTSQAYTYMGWKVTTTFEWYYNPAGQPANLVNPLATIKKSIDTAFNGKNGCGLNGIVVKQVYKGTTTKLPAVTSTTCNARDRYNVVGWGNLAPPIIARTCTWSSSSRMIESDMLINSGQRKFFIGAIPAGCRDFFDLESVVVHETGHILGLGHSSDPVQVMAATEKPCQTGKRLFLSGDMLGLRGLYA